jgi:hypothetical protein
MTGKIFIASMNMRGKWAEPLEPTSIKVNVTSAQGKTNKNRRDFSPMTQVEGGYKGFWNFESYWQSGKVFEGIDIIKVKKWWLSLTEAKRRYPNSKGKKVLYSVWDGEEHLDYITSRKKVYVPEYYTLIKDREMTNYWIEQLKSGKNITIYDFDGPRTIDGDVSCMELTEDLLVDKINNTRFPFGHGYIVAATIAGIEPNIYVN